MQTSFRKDVRRGTIDQECDETATLDGVPATHVNAQPAISAHPSCTNSPEPRVEQIRTLAGRLLDSTILNTAMSRARCRELAAELIRLIEAEDQYQQAQAVAADVHLQATQRPPDLLRACEVGEHAELSTNTV